MYPTIEILGHEDALWSFSSSDGPVTTVAAPCFSIDSESVSLAAPLQLAGTTSVSDHIKEATYIGQVRDKELEVQLLVRLSDSSPAIRYKYVLSGRGILTKPGGKEAVELTRFSVDPATTRATEVRLFDYNSLTHGYIPTEVQIEVHDFANHRKMMGPILTWTSGQSSEVQVLAAYEHGSQWPDAYLSFTLDDTSVRIVGIRGSYDTDHDLSSRPYETVWLQALAVTGTQSDLRHIYRQFILNSQCPYPASRRPKVFYNTWNNQERVKCWHDSQFLTAMNEKQILAEIDAANEMGIEVYVLDVGWFESTGDWRVSTKRFPHGLGPVKRKLDEYGMQLGLWFGPTTAAMSSAILKKNLDNRMTWRGELLKPREVWETELSAECCLVSGYADDFADVLVSCSKEYGVTYFKWDAVEQYGCDDPNHHHGDAEHMSAQERAERYAFLQPIYMSRIVERVQRHVPEAIVDFDITESARCVGLAFLSVGKYFLTNNGPYYFEYDIPNDGAKSGYNFIPGPSSAGTIKYGTTYDNINVFFHPGAARDWPCRTGLAEFDRWIPSTLFLVHYLPDDEPKNNQLTSIASLSLGHGGIWGDLLAVSPEGRKTFHHTLSLLQQVRDPATQVSMERIGHVGGMIEGYDKVEPATGRGVVIVFTGRRLERFWGGVNETGIIPARTTLTTRAKRVDTTFESVCGPGCEVEVGFDKAGRAMVSVSSVEVSVAMVFFGI